MDLVESKHRDVSIVGVCGRVDASTAPTFEQKLLALIDAGTQRVVIDCTDLDYISSAGLRVLLVAAKRLKEPPAALVLCGVGPGVRTVLELAGFLPLFAVEAGREQALARVAGS